MINTYIASLVQYGLHTGLIEACDKTYMINQLLQVMQLDAYEEAPAKELPLEEILSGLVEDAITRGVCQEDITSRDLFDTKLMGVLTPYPREVRATFTALYAASPEKATDWYYKLSQDTDYIRRYRIKKDLRWKTKTEYGELDITVNITSSAPMQTCPS